MTKRALVGAREPPRLFQIVLDDRYVGEFSQVEVPELISAGGGLLAGQSWNTRSSGARRGA